MTINEQIKIAGSYNLYSVQIARIKNEIGILPIVVWTADVHDIEQLVRCITKDIIVFDASCGSSKDFDSVLYKSKGMPILVKNTEQAEVDLIEDIWYALKDGKKIIAHAKLTHGSVFTPRLCSQIGVGQICYLYDNDEETQFIKDNHEDAKEMRKNEAKRSQEKSPKDYESVIKKWTKECYEANLRNHPEISKDETLRAAYKQAKAQLKHVLGVK